MTISKILKKLTAFSLVSTAVLLSSTATAAPLKIGVVPGIFADSVAVAAQEAKKQGVDVQVIEFTDWATPNVALDAGDIDLNYYQNSNYLANAVRDKGFKLVSVQPGNLSYLGLYSLKHATLADLPDRSDERRVGKAS